MWVRDGAGPIGPVRIVECHPEKERTSARGIQKRRERFCRLGRVPLELPLCVRPEVGLGHVAGEVATFLQHGWEDALSVGEGSMQVLGPGCVSVLAGEGADSRGAALGCR